MHLASAYVPAWKKYQPWIGWSGGVVDQVWEGLGGLVNK